MTSKGGYLEQIVLTPPKAYLPGSICSITLYPIGYTNTNHQQFIVLTGLCLIVADNACSKAHLPWTGWQRLLR